MGEKNPMPLARRSDMLSSRAKITLRNRLPWVSLSVQYHALISRVSTSLHLINLQISTIANCAMASPRSNSPKPGSPKAHLSPEPPADPNSPIEAEETGGLDDDDDDDEAYCSETASTSSTSITSSIRAHTFEDGIRYHKFHDGKYAFPNDETEQNRDDMKHAMTLLLCGDRLHFAPIGDMPQNIIDLGRY